MNSDRPDLRVAITGGIGSGKSFVCQCLLSHGIRVYDCDAAAKRLMREDPEVIQGLKDVVGENAYVDGKLNKVAVAQFLLASHTNQLLINGVVHPAVARDFLASPYRWLESAILYDCGFQRYVDRVVCVTAPMETRLDRIMLRDGITREQARQWVDKQMDQELVRQRADYEIVNDGQQDIDSQVRRILHDLTIGKADGADNTTAQR